MILRLSAVIMLLLSLAVAAFVVLMFVWMWRFGNIDPGDSVLGLILVGMLFAGIFLVLLMCVSVVIAFFGVTYATRLWLERDRRAPAWTLGVGLAMLAINMGVLWLFGDGVGPVEYEDEIRLFFRLVFGAAAAVGFALLLTSAIGGKKVRTVTFSQVR